jgi:3-hydroxyacyl-[acyl-carrier-protein] dehydratase
MSGQGFCFIDEVLESNKDESLTARFTLKGTEEFLKDHFPAFPVMPGVLLLESLKQAAERLLSTTQKAVYRLVSAQDVKFGQFVKPGSSLKITVCKLKEESPFIFFDGRIESAGRKVLTGGMTLAPLES